VETVTDLLMQVWAFALVNALNLTTVLCMGGRQQADHGGFRNAVAASYSTTTGRQAEVAGVGWRAKCGLGPALSVLADA
jgi:hypothetical protein